MADGELSVYLKYTEAEWKALDDYARMKKSPNFRTFLNYALHDIAEKVDERKLCIDCGDQLIIRRANIFNVPAHIAPQISCLAKKSDISIAALVLRLVASPAFRSYYDDKIC